MFSEKFTLIEYAFILAGAIVFSFLINSLFLRFSRNLGIRNNNDISIRWSNMAKPSLGGISFYILFLLSITAYFILFNHSTFVLSKQLLGLLSACSFAFLMGLADDAYDTKPVLKLSVQVICALMLIYTGTSIHLFDNHSLNNALTVFWVVGLMNSINMIDNMDGIATGISLAIVSGTLLLMYSTHEFNSVDAVLLIGVMGALTGFLFFNVFPSKLFMGDTGSQFLGIFLAAIGIRFFWNGIGEDEVLIPSRQVISALLAFLIPISDTGSVVLNRMLKGKSPFIGGKDHTTHCLFYSGITERRIFLLFSFISFFSIMLNVIIFNYITWSWMYAGLFGGFILLVSGSLFVLTRKKG